MTKFPNELKRQFLTHCVPILPIFGPKKIVPENSAVTHNFTWDSSTILKFRKNLQHNSKEKPRQTEGRKDRQKDWRMDGTDRPYFIVPFRLPPGLKKGSQLKHAVFNSIKNIRELTKLFNILYSLYKANKRGNKI